MFNDIKGIPIHICKLLRHQLWFTAAVVFSFNKVLKVVAHTTPIRICFQWHFKKFARRLYFAPTQIVNVNTGANVENNSIAKHTLWNAVVCCTVLLSTSCNCNLGSSIEKSKCQGHRLSICVTRTVVSGNEGNKTLTECALKYYFFARIFTMAIPKVPVHVHYM